MNNAVGQGLTNSFVCRCVIISLHTLKAEWALQIACQLGQYLAEKVVQVVFPRSIVSKAVAIAHIPVQVG